MGTDIAKVPPITWAAPEGDAKRRAAAAEERRAAKARAAEGGYGTVPPDGRLTIEEDKATGQFVYRIVDQKTGEVLKQWPREEVLRMQHALEAMRGSILDRRV